MRRGAFVQNQAGETPLHLAARRSLVSIVQHLIKLGASVTLLDKNGTTHYYYYYYYSLLTYLPTYIGARSNDRRRYWPTMNLGFHRDDEIDLVLIQNHSICFVSVKMNTSERV